MQSVAADFQRAMLVSVRRHVLFTLHLLLLFLLLLLLLLLLQLLLFNDTAVESSGELRWVVCEKTRTQNSLAVLCSTSSDTRLLDLIEFSRVLPGWT
jgi:hypothetical protein